LPQFLQIADAVQDFQSAQLTQFRCTEPVRLTPMRENAQKWHPCSLGGERIVDIIAEV
jgi:hypothetical protein